MPDVVHDPLVAKDYWPEDQTHALITGIPATGRALEDAVFDVLAQCVERHLPALGD